MNILFIHQNIPGQFKHLGRHLADDPAHNVVFVTNAKEGTFPHPRVRKELYGLTRKPSDNIHNYLRRTEAGVLYGQGVVRALQRLKSSGFIPDVIIGHSGWGETFFVKDVYPATPFICYSEFYYRAHNADMDFDPASPPDLDSILRARVRNTHLLHALTACDRAITPTEWQKSVHPPIFLPKIDVIHEGVDTARLVRRPDVAFTLPDGRTLTAGDEVVLYIARNLEPYRGFVSFMRALPRIRAARPNAIILIIGGDEISYGSGPTDAKNWREKMTAEIPIDPERVIFLGKLPYERFLDAVQIATVHVYLTYPFVLSWSMLESMSLENILVASRTAPVEEVIEHGVNGLLVDFFDPKGIADQVLAVLEDPGAHAALRRRARETVVARYDLSLCLSRQYALISEVTGVPLTAPV